MGYYPRGDLTQVFPRYSEFKLSGLASNGYLILIAEGRFVLKFLTKN
jgi:hypothetical protein